jgi:antirestriction protein ArdC
VGQDGQPVLDSQKKFVKDRVRLERPKVITAAVFNAEQIDGIPALDPERTYDWDPVEQAEKLLKASGAKIEHAQKGGAYYRLSSDTIHLHLKTVLRDPTTIMPQHCTSSVIGQGTPPVSTETLGTRSDRQATRGRSSAQRSRA